MKIEALKREAVTVEVDAREVLCQVLHDIIRYIRPFEVYRYIDWRVDENGDLIGIHFNSGPGIEYGDTNLGPADQRVREVFHAVEVLRRNMDVLPSED